MKKRILIFSGGTLDVGALRHIDRNTDFVIGADRGALFLLKHGIQPDAAFGDFDSVNASELETIKNASSRFTQVDAVDKDATDTELAFQWSIEQKAEEIVLLGATGTRLDHTLANIHLLKTALEYNITCKIIDHHNEIRLINRETRIKRTDYRYVSLLPLSLHVSGIRLEGFLYPLDSAVLKLGQTLGISNELVRDVGVIRIESGLLLVIQSKD